MDSEGLTWGICIIKSFQCFLFKLCAAVVLVDCVIVSDEFFPLSSLCQGFESPTISSDVDSFWHSFKRIFEWMWLNLIWWTCSQSCTILILYLSLFSLPTPPPTLSHSVYNRPADARTYSGWLCTCTQFDQIHSLNTNNQRTAFLWRLLD